MRIADRVECEKFAEEMGLTFIVWGGSTITLAGWKSEERESTEEEVIMWSMLGGPMTKMVDDPPESA